jgi:hypothetical protein
VDTVVDLYSTIRRRYPELAANADKEHVRLWGEINEELAFVWFESLAAAVNSGMGWGTPHAEHRALFMDMGAAFRTGSNEVRRCIDVSFVENLFWEVPADKVQVHWRSLPSELQDLYVSFHKRTPL